jgi:hypothetical protein
MNDKKSEVFIELRRQLSQVSQSELELAWSRAKKFDSIGEQVGEVKRLVQEFRTPLTPANPVFTIDESREFYRSLDEAAARELSAGVNKALAELESQKAQIEAGIIAERAAINAKHNEFHRLTEKAGSLKADVAGYAQARAEIASAEQDYERLYRAACKGQSVNPQAFIGLTDTIVNRDIKLRVIDRLEAETKSALADLRRRNQQLAREIGLQPHNI